MLNAYITQVSSTVVDMPSDIMYSAKREIRDERESKTQDFILETSPSENSGSPTDNLVVKELQSVLKPMNMMQAVFFCAKYKIRDNMIMTNSVSYNVFSIFAMFIVTCGCYYFTFESPLRNDEMGIKFYQHLVKVYIFIVICFGTFLNYCSNIMQRHSNILFVMKIQAIYTKIEINEVLKRVIIPNWISVLALDFYHIMYIAFSYFIIDFLGLKMGLSFTTYVWLSYDMNVFYATRVMKILTETVKSWVKKVKNYEDVEHSQNEDYWKTMFDVYLEILEAYKLYGKTFHHLVCLFIHIKQYFLLYIV